MVGINWVLTPTLSVEVVLFTGLAPMSDLWIVFIEVFSLVFFGVVVAVDDVF